MQFKLHTVKRGTHIHINVFVGPEERQLALAGELVMRPKEAEAFAALLCPPEEVPSCKCGPFACGHSRDCPDWREPR